MKKIAIITLVLIFAIGMGFAGGGNEENSGSESSEQEMQMIEGDGDGYYPVTITTHNYAREEVELTFYKAPERIVVVNPNPLEILIELGLGDKIVQANTRVDRVSPQYHEALEAIPLSRDSTKEQVLGFQPDFIYGWYSTFRDESFGEVDFWHERNINTYMALNSATRGTGGNGIQSDVENEYYDILTIGKIFNVEDKAQAIVDEMKAKVAKGQEYVKNRTPVKIVILEDEGDVFRIYGENTVGGDIAMQVGANLLAKDKAVRLSAEDLILLDPDMIFSIHFGEQSTSLNPAASVKVFNDNPAFANMKAFKNDAIYPTDLSFVYNPGMRVLDSLDFFLEKLYPDME